MDDETEKVTDKARENRMRRAAQSKGFMLRKDRARSTSINHQGGWMIIHAQFNSIVSGQNFDLTLDDVEKFLSE